MNILKSFLAGALALSCVTVANATPINVGGIVWDPDQAFSFPALPDFSSNGSLIEDATNGIPGDTVKGYGKITHFNSSVNNEASFCPSCELTFTFELELVSVTPTSGNSADFVFNVNDVSLFVDSTPDYNGTSPTAADGNLWLQLVGNGTLNGSGDDIGTGFDKGDGSANLDLVGGIAMGNFDTNTGVDGSDLSFTSSFQPIFDGGQPTGLLFGTVDIKGESIPEPASLALIGLGLLGLGATARKKAA